jgi:predicted DNA-binding transcriptional regulator AlpA
MKEILQSIMPLIDEGAVARQLDCEVKTLQAWRSRGFGPPYRKIGRLVRYDPQEVAAWSESRTMRSTSESPRDAA